MPRLFPLAAAGALLATAVAQADTPVAPSWLKVDPASRTTEVDIIAAFNDNNSNWNFNGYHTGNATVRVPTGWTVEVPFSNAEEDVPHSLLVIADPGGDPEEYPIEAAADLAAFAGAHSPNPIDGTETGQSESFSFRADTAGEYLWYCGVPGHGPAGMFIRLSVSDDVEAPEVTLAADAEPGRD